MTVVNYEDYLVKDKFPLFWCAGCGNGSVLNALVRTFAEKQFDKHKTVVVTGIGCWGKADDYISTNTFHGTHGRALGFATGIKLANPELKVIVLMGDGDSATIGGNHLIHAARRNVDLTAIVVNNLNYGMTGGQYSGTTPENSFTTTSLYGHVEQSFDLCKLVESAGASYVARSSIYNIVQLQKFIAEAIDKKGFSFVEAISPCTTHYGCNNGLKTAPAMIKWLKDKFILGKFVDIEKDDYSTKYSKVVELAREIQYKGSELK